MPAGVAVGVVPASRLVAVGAVVALVPVVRPESAVLFGAAVLPVVPVVDVCDCGAFVAGVLVACVDAVSLSAPEPAVVSSPVPSLPVVWDVPVSDVWLCTASFPFATSFLVFKKRHSFFMA